MLGKTVLIIGGSDGIGEKTAESCLKLGATVYNASRTPSNLEKVTNITVDVSNPSTIEDCVKIITDTSRRLDYVIYSAGMSIASPADQTQRNDYRYLYEVNLFGLIETIKHTVPLLKQSGGGRIIAISSLASIVPVPYEAFYSSSKAALNALAMELNLELNHDNIFVTALLPGGVATDFSYKRKVYTSTVEDSETLSAELSAAKTIFDIEQQGDDPQIIADAVIKTALKSTPDVVKIVGIMPKISAFTYKILPQRLALKILSRKFGLHHNTSGQPQQPSLPDS